MLDSRAGGGDCDHRGACRDGQLLTHFAIGASAVPVRVDATQIDDDNTSHASKA